MSDEAWLAIVLIVLAIAAIVGVIIVLTQRVDDLEKRVPRTLRDFNARRAAPTPSDSALPEMRTARTDRAARAARLPSRRPGVTPDPMLDRPQSHPNRGA